MGRSDRQNDLAIFDLHRAPGWHGRVLPARLNRVLFWPSLGKHLEKLRREHVFRRPRETEVMLGPLLSCVMHGRLTVGIVQRSAGSRQSAPSRCTGFELFDTNGYLPDELQHISDYLDVYVSPGLTSYG